MECQSILIKHDDLCIHMISFMIRVHSADTVSRSMLAMFSISDAPIIMNL